jgi:hypothetical protein
MKPEPYKLGAGHDFSFISHFQLGCLICLVTILFIYNFFFYMCTVEFSGPLLYVLLYEIVIHCQRFFFLNFTLQWKIQGRESRHTLWWVLVTWYECGTVQTVTMQGPSMWSLYARCFYTPSQLSGLLKPQCSLGWMLSEAHSSTV